MYLMESTSIVTVPDRDTIVLLNYRDPNPDSKRGEKMELVVLFAASTHSPASSHTERKSAEPRPDL